MQVFLLLKESDFNYNSPYYYRVLKEFSNKFFEDTRYKDFVFRDNVEFNIVSSEEELKDKGVCLVLVDSGEDYDFITIVTGKQIGRASCRERVSSPV